MGGLATGSLELRVMRNHRRRLALVVSAWIIAGALSTGNAHAMASGSDDERGLIDWLMEAALKARCLIQTHVFGSCDCP